AGGEAGKLLSLADYAEKNGNVDLARTAYDTAAQQSPKLRPAQQGRLRIAQRTGDTKKIHAVLAEMLKIWPNDAAVQNDEGYLRLLLLNQQQSQVESRKAKVENAQQRGATSTEQRENGQQPPSSDLQAPGSELQ